ncbi:MAG: hypothetical protein ACK4FV_07460 [Candidatus Nitrosocaldus sp.]
MIDTLLIETLLSSLTYILPTLAGGVIGIYSYYAFKKRLHAVRQFLDALDDALYDDKISEEEFRTLWSKFKQMI